MMIKVNNLSYSYPKSKEIVLKNLTFEINEGEIFGFLGPSGAGKSTAQKVLYKRMIVRREESHKLDERVLKIEDIKEIERENIIRALRKSNYKVYGADGAASLIGSKPTTLISRIKTLRIPMRPSD